MAQGNKQDALQVLADEANQNDAWKTSITLLYQKGKLYHSEKNYEDAQKEFLKVDSIAKKHNYIDKNTVLAIVERALISKSTFSHDGTETANTLLELALIDAQELNDPTVTNAVYKDLAYIKFLMKEHDICKMYLERALPYYLNTKETASVSRLYNIYKIYYIALDSLTKAEDMAIKRVDYLRQHNDSIELAKAIGALGEMYSYRLNQIDRAMPYLNEAKLIYDTTHDTLHRPYLYLVEELAICNAETGNYKLGYEYYKQAYRLRKDIVRESNDITTRRLEARFQAKEKEQEIALLTSKNELSEQQKTNQRNLLLGGIGLTSIAGLFFFVLYRNRQKTTKKLQELDTFKSKLFENISHEFRTPLTLISGPIDKRLQSETLEEEDRSEFKMIQRNSKRLLNLVNQLLDLSKLESGHLTLKVVQGDLSSLLHALASSFQYKANQKHIDYTINITEINEAWFDKDVIEKISVNLLSNAFKYTSEDGHVTFSASTKDNHIEYYIENDSQQFTKEQIENIFNRFYQINDNADGVGIGLSLVKELVTLSHGEISVENASDKSIAFRVRLPFLKSQFKPNDIVEAVFKPSDIETNRISTETDILVEQSIDEDLPILLIVDDNADIRTFIKSAFKDQYQVVEANDGDIGISKAIDLIPDMIISDVMMPKRNGYELSETLKKDPRTCHIPIILLTAKADDADRFMGLETGADDYIVKPFKIQGLETRVKNLIASREQLRQRYSQELVLRPKDIAVTNIDELFLEKVQEVLDKNLVESSFSTEDFSKAVGLSRMQLHRKIKALTGLTASEFIRSQRLKLAAELLKTSDINVSQIGYTVGFNNHSYFAKCFKEAYKCTPSAYAKKHS
jgi:signal transduction histidine kinase/DNA-binding response OmpR family regulator